ncbi:hypothetical protein CU098_009451 [Rhizopus stolonifer]|uniref:Uncharacterized protein n=1 Tax=Rhizopus stolonifer TaxID=4846 RepID=A0A367JIQ1_RHIST|nr:hypothetical protein CU098_009451 [Rhizopus stolonifer]
MTEQNKPNEEDNDTTLLPPEIPAPPPPSTKDTSSLLSPWWSEKPTTTQDRPDTNSKPSTFLLGINRSLEYNGDKELGWKEKCYLFTNAPKMNNGESDRDHLETLFDHSKDCTMPRHLKDAKNIFLKAKQGLIIKKESSDYYNINIGKETSHSGEHVSRVIKKTFSPLQHMSQRYIDSWKDGTQQAFFTKFWTRLERGDAFYLVKDCTKRLIENMLEDKKPSDKK